MKKYVILAVNLLAINFAVFAQSVAEISSAAGQYYENGAYQEAAQSFEAAAELSWLPAERKSLYYNAACSHALAGNKEKAIQNLRLAVDHGFSNKEHLVQDPDLKILWEDSGWKPLVDSVEEVSFSSDPEKIDFHVEDIPNFYRALAMAIKDTLKAPEIFKQEYVLKGSVGLQDFYSSKIRDVQALSDYVLKNQDFYYSVKETLLETESVKEPIVENLRRFKELYPEAVFPDIYFVIGRNTSNGTVSDTGLLLGVEVMSKTKDNYVAWPEALRNWVKDFSGIPVTAAHEIVHFNQQGMAMENTLLKYAVTEGSAEFIAELLSGSTDGDYTAFEGREKNIWKDFKKDMHQDKYSEWHQAREPHRPRNALYWAGYLICKSYYLQAEDKELAIHDILNVQDYTTFYKKSRVEAFLDSNF